MLYIESDKWLVDDRNDLILRGDDAEGFYWIYDSEAKFVHADDHTNLIEGDGTSNKIDNGSSASGAFTAGTIVDGNNTSTVINGGSGATDGGKGTYINGNGSVVDNTGGTTASGEKSTGIDITGNNDKVINGGESTITSGGTGINIDGNYGQVDNKGETTVSGEGSTGTKIKGDDAVINNSGKTDVTESATGTKINGNGADVVNTGETTASGSGSAGTVITGDGAVVDNSGKTDVTEGGTGTNIDGKNARVDNKGEATVSGEGSTGTQIKGDDATVNNSGKTDVTAGGTGTKIDGNGANVVNTGETTAGGTGSAGTVITGDNAKVSDQGSTTVTDNATGIKIDGNGADVTIKGDSTNPAIIDVSGGGKGVVINGDDASITIEDATATVDGAGSALAIITGDNATANIGGDIYVKNAAHGIEIAGDNSTVNTTARFFVQDLNSIGINITAVNDGADEHTTFNNTGDINVTKNATGAMIAGDKANVTLGGNINVNSVKDDAGVLQLGTGVNVNGNNASVQIDGNVNLTSDAVSASDITKIASGYMEGVKVTGENNDITIKGAINANATGAIKSDGAKYGLDDKSAVWVGVEVTGQNDHVKLDGGINLTLDTGSAPLYAEGVHLIGLDVSGNNTVDLAGTSVIKNTSARVDNVMLAKVEGGALLNVEEGAELKYTAALNSGTPTDGVAGEGVLNAAGNGSKIINNGTLSFDGNFSGFAVNLTDGASFENNGTLQAEFTNHNQSALVSTDNAGTTAINNGLIKVIQTVQPVSSGLSKLMPIGSYSSTTYAMLALDPSEITNSATGTIDLQGAGVFGMASNLGGSVANVGTINLDGFIPVTDGSGNVTNKTAYTPGLFYLRGAAMVAGSTSTQPNNSAQAINTGNITVNNSGFGMLALKGGTVTNQGTITLTADATTVSDGRDSGATQLVAMGAYKGGTAINDTTGIININTDIGRAFYNGGSGNVIVNKGTVNYMGSAIGNGDVHMGSTPQSQVAGSPVRVQGYRVGTNADGSSGKFYGNNLDVSEVTVDTGFTEGTDAKIATLNDVVVGSDIAGAESIQADSVVWKAEGKTDASGNVDVTMTKKAYTDVVTDSSVNSVAGALEAGYTNNALFQSLNLKTAKDVTNAMKQISGSKATTAFNEAKVLSNRFTMLADNAVVNSNGLGFNVVAKGDKRSELGNNTQYDMMALSQKLSLTDNQTLKLQYGIARLDGNGDVKSAGDNGLTGGYSQFFGLEHEMDLGNNLSWDNALRYDNHQLNSSRSIQYGSVNEVANANNSQQYMEMKSQFSKGYDLSETLKFKPSIGAKVRHTRDGGVSETGASDYNLKMDAGSETAVDAIAGMELTYAGKNGWAATASVEGGPNLSYSKSARSASLQGAAGQHFNVDDGQKGGGVNSLSQVGVSYSQGNTSLGMDAYNWKEDGASDKGLNLNLKVKF